MKPQFTDEQLATLREAVDYIVAEPEAYDQNTWAQSGAPGDYHEFKYTNLPSTLDKYPSCGTVGCLAGWITMIADPKLRNTASRIGSQARTIAMQKLGLNKDQANRLFGASSTWPEPFNFEYREATTHKEKACVLYRRVEHFIETGE